MTIPGLDSALSPLLQQAERAWNMGFRWWGFYIQGVGNTDPLHAWSPGEEEVLRQVGFKPVPICIPSPEINADPVLMATQAYESCKNYGLSPEVSICYNGEHLQVSGPVWNPSPGPTPTSVAHGCAVQFGQMSIGLNVDTNMADEAFPFDKGIVCDLEHNAGYSAQWYGLFQHTIAALSKIKEGTMQVVNDQDKIYIVGNAKDNGNLLVFEFTKNPPSVGIIDCTFASGAGPGKPDPRTYQLVD